MSVLIATQQLKAADPTTSSRGVRSAAITGDRGQLCTFKPNAPLRIPFEPSAYMNPEATRVNLVFAAPAELQEQLGNLDSWATAYATEHSERLFKRAMTHDQVVEMYKPTIHRSDKYEPTLKTKANMEGRQKLRVWTPEREAREPPEDWRDCDALPMIVVRGFYFQTKEFGLILETTDILIHERTRACPF